MGTNPTKVLHAENSKPKETDAGLLIAEICRVVGTKREALAKQLVDIAEGGNATMLKTLLDLVTQSGASDEANRIETLKRITALEAACAQCNELSEETADDFPSGREPE